jgi:hypothetical protein
MKTEMFSMLDFNVIGIDYMSVLITHKRKGTELQLLDPVMTLSGLSTIIHKIELFTRQAVKINRINIVT